MPKHGQKVTNASGSDTDPDNIEHLKGTKSEVENHVKRILKLVRNEVPKKKGGNRERVSELVGLIEEFHKQYVSLYARYNHLREEYGKNANDRKAKKRFSSSPSSSDSEYYSSEEVGSRGKDRINQPEMSIEVNDLKHKLASISEEKEALNSNYAAALHKIQEAEAISNNLRNEADEKKKRLSGVLKMHEAHVSDSSSRIKELEGKLRGLESEMVSLRSQKKELEEQVKNKTTETKKLGEENVRLHTRISELELVTKNRRDEMSDLVKKIKDNETSSKSKIQELMALSSNLQLEVDSLRKISSRDEETELKLETKTEEVSRNMIQIESLKEELATRAATEERLLEEREGLTAKIKDLEANLETLCNWQSKLDEQTRKKFHENYELELHGEREKLVNVMQEELDFLSNNKTKDSSENVMQIASLKEELARRIAVEHTMVEEKEELQARILELEASLTEKVNELSVMLKKFEAGEKKSLSQITTLKTQLESLQQELQSVQTQKRRLDYQTEKEKQESSESQLPEIQMRSKSAYQHKTLREPNDPISKLNEKEKAASPRSPRLKITEFRRISKEPYYTIKNLSEEFSKQVKGLSQESKLNIQAADKKMEELAEEFRMYFEDRIRLLSRRILIAEQLHTENKDSYKSTRERLEHENKVLLERLAAYETELSTIRNIPETTSTVNEEIKHVQHNLDHEHVDVQVDDKEEHEYSPEDHYTTTILRLEQENKVLLEKIAAYESEVTEIKDIPETTTVIRDEIKHAQHNVDHPDVQLVDKEEPEFPPSNMDSSLMNVMTKLEKKVEDLEVKIKEKDEGLLSLGEEKREAIRQLCILNDYHRARCDHLKDVISKMTTRTKRMKRR